MERARARGYFFGAMLLIVAAGFVMAEDSSYRLGAGGVNVKSYLNDGLQTPAVAIENSDGTAADLASETTLSSLKALTANIGTTLSALNTAVTTLSTNVAAIGSTISTQNDSGRVKVSGLAAVITNSTTRPSDTTSYASGDLIANSTTSTSVVPITLTVGRGSSGGAATGIIPRIRLNKSTSGLTNASYRVHMYNAAPATINAGDNGAWLTSGSANYMGAFDVTMDRAFTDGASGNGVPVTGPFITFGVQTVYALIEARAAYAPGNAEVFTLSVESHQN